MLSVAVMNAGRLGRSVPFTQDLSMGRENV